MIPGLFEVDGRLVERTYQLIVAPDNDWATEDWPWCTCCDPIEALPVESEIKEVTTFKPAEMMPDLVVDWYTGYQDATYESFDDDPMDIRESYQVFVRLKFGVELPYEFPTEQTVKARYAFHLQEFNESSSEWETIEFSDTGEIELELETGVDEVVDDTWIEYPESLPGGANVQAKTVLTGPPAQPVLGIHIHTGGGTAKKLGFPAYSNYAADDVRIYRKETITGQIAACPSSGISAETFAGDHEYDASLGYIDNLSADCKARRFHSLSRIQSARSAMSGITTDTNTVVRSEFPKRCNGVTQPDFVQAELSDEFTDAELDDELDDLLSNYTGDKEDAEIVSDFSEPIVLAAKHSPESGVTKTEIKGLFYFSLNASELVHPLPYESQDITIAYDIVTIDLDTYEKTVAGSTATVTIDDPETVSDSSVIAVTASEGEFKFLSNVRITSTPVFHKFNPEIIAGTDAVTVYSPTSG